ncbi:MAG TPA: glycosyltransferase family 2 protein, partial [Chitinophagaceae bacterium]|nr:glycosyltransferase family 2 protein [Chitinophagaceae bacterium]
MIITYNEEKNIGRCLDSVKLLADEIIVLDAYSTDKTVEIAKSRGALVKQGYFLGYIQQKNSAISFASNNYILSLDADEALDEALINSILEVKLNFAADAYSMNRCTNYCGKYIRNGTWYPDKKIRLFDKRVAHWGGTNPHDKIELPGENKQVKHLKGDILHYSFPTIEQHLEKNNKYSSIAARALFARGAKSSWFKILVNPFWAFFHGFVIRRGFLDGFYGFVISINTAHGTFLKYIKLYHLQRTQKTKQATSSARANT